VKDTPLGLDLSGIEQVRVMAGRVIEIRLYRPMPYLLQLLAQPELGLQQEKQGDGPMVLTRRGAVARFTPIEPSRLGLPQVPDWDERTRAIDMTALPAERAVSQFNDGLADLVMGGSVVDFPLTSSVGILRGTIQLDPVQGLFGLQVSRARGFLADARHREALAMAIDRPALLASFGVSGWTPTTRLLAAGLEGDVQVNGERWADMPIAQRRAEAAARVSQWQAAQGNPRVAIWLPPVRAPTFCSNACQPILARSALPVNGRRIAFPPTCGWWMKLQAFRARAGISIACPARRERGCAIPRPTPSLPARCGWTMRTSALPFWPRRRPG